MITSQSDTCIRESDPHADVTVMSNYYDLRVGSCNDILFLSSCNCLQDLFITSTQPR